MKQMNYILMVLFLMYSLAIADEGRTGQAGFTFVKIPVGARQVGMGNSGFASSTGASAIYWNPAGVTARKGYEAQFSNISWFGGVSYQQFSGISEIGDESFMGLAIQYLSYPDLVETTEESPDGTGAMLKSYDMALVLNYARQMTDRVSFGINAKYLNETIALVSADAFAFDIGLTYKTGLRGLSLGFAISNYGTKGQFTGSGLRRFIIRPDGPTNQTPVPVVYESDNIELPSSVEAGVSYAPNISDDMSININADHMVNTFSADRSNLGFELGFKHMFFLRGGYVTNTDFNENGGGNATFGAGVQYPIDNNVNLCFDYAFADLGMLNNAHYITLGVQF